MATGLNPRTPPEGRDSLAVSLRVVSFGLFLALIVGVAVSVAFLQGGTFAQDHPAALLLTALIVILFLVPLAVMYLRIRAQFRTVERLAAAARMLAAGERVALPEENLTGDAADLARAIGQLRATIDRQARQLAEQTHLTTEIINGISEGLLAIDRERKVVLANDRLVQLLGVTGPTTGRPLLEVLRSVPLADAFERALSGEESTERISGGAGGTTRQLEVRLMPMTGSPDVAAAALFIDVTRLEQLERVRRDFVADFSHEVRTPLAAMRSAVETLEAAGLDEQQEERLRSILIRQLKRLENLVHDVGELKQIESGEVVLQRSEIDLRAIADDVAGDVSTRPDARNVRIRVSGERVFADGDPQRIEQVLFNLVDNAVRYGSAGGEVAVDVGREGDDAVVRVTDYGHGIPAEEQERIFNRFYRLDRSRSATGRGLGLAIARHLVLLHGGTLTVRSEPGKGATFEMRLPGRG